MSYGGKRCRSSHKPSDGMDRGMNKRFDSSAEDTMLGKTIPQVELIFFF